MFFLMLSLSFAILTILHIYKMFNFYLQYFQPVCVFVVCVVGVSAGGSGCHRLTW